MSTNPNNTLTLNVKIGDSQTFDFINCNSYSHTLLDYISDSLIERDSEYYSQEEYDLDTLTFANPEIESEFKNAYREIDTYSYENKGPQINSEVFYERLINYFTTQYDSTSFNKEVLSVGRELISDCLAEFNRHFKGDYLIASDITYITQGSNHYLELNLHIRDTEKLYEELENYIRSKLKINKDHIIDHFKELRIYIGNGEYCHINISEDFEITKYTLEYILNYWFNNELSTDCLSKEGADYELYHRVSDLGYTIFEYLSDSNAFDKLISILGLNSKLITEAEAKKIPLFN